MLFKVSATTEEGVFIEIFDVPVPEYVYPADQLSLLEEDPAYMRWSLDHRIDDALHIEYQFGKMTIAVTRRSD